MIDTGERSRQRALLVGVQTQNDPLSGDLSELAELLRTAGTDVVGSLVQQREGVHPDLYVGTGKVEEVKAEAERLNANLVVCDDEITARQERNLEERLGIAVIDRTALILDIFADHAHSAEGKLQVELAQLEYNMARMRGLWTHLERLGGGVGTRGPGESQIETDRRLARDRITALRARLSKLAQTRQLMSKQREASSVPKLALIGYTNAGKSTLMNRLCASNVSVKDRLFHTLDPTTRVATVTDFQCLVTDTVGFIRKLPHGIVEAFKATLDVASSADILLNVIAADVSDEVLSAVQASVSGVLAEIGAGDVSQIVIFNKVDLLTEQRHAELKQRFPDAEFISAGSGVGTGGLVQRIEREIRQQSVTLELLVPYSDAKVVSELHSLALSITTRNEQSGTAVTARVKADLADRYRQYSSTPLSGDEA